MKRISIEWDESGLVGGIVKGTVTIAEGNFTIDMPTTHSYRIEVGKHSISMRRMDDVYLPPDAKDHRDIIHTMAECYYAGLTDKKDLYHWITKKE